MLVLGGPTLKMVSTVVKRENEGLEGARMKGAIAVGPDGEGGGTLKGLGGLRLKVGVDDEGRAL